MPGRLSLATVGQLIGLTQYPVEARFRGDVEATVGQSRYDLTGRHRGEFFAVGNGQHALAFVLAELVGRLAPLRGQLAAIGLHTTVLTPALKRTR